jgi:hypothetical protein
MNPEYASGRLSQRDWTGQTLMCSDKPNKSMHTNLFMKTPNKTILASGAA